MFSSKVIILLVPYPAQGHVTPMLSLASLLSSLGFHPLLLLPHFFHRRLLHDDHHHHHLLSSCISIPDGLHPSLLQPDFFSIESSMENHLPFHLEDFILRHLLSPNTNQLTVSCMVVDLLASYAINVAHRCGIQVAGFWPAMLSVYSLIASIPRFIRSGLLSQSGFPLHEGPICLVPGQPMITTEHLPWLIGSPAARTARFKFWVRTINRAKKLDHLLVNSFAEEGSHHLLSSDSSFQDSPRILPVGPLNLLAAPTRSIYGKASFWEEDFSCLEWLDKQADGSVVYVSFGSWVSPIGEAKVKSLALALQASRRPFIWVLGQSWREGLPKGYLEGISKQGKVVSWAPQLEVLQHKAVGCYLTHCGWNSTVEAIQCRKRLLCYPVAGDQFLNCEYIVKTWGIGVRLNGLGHKDVEEGLRRVSDDSGMTHRIDRLKERMMGGDALHLSMNFLKEFVHHLQKSAAVSQRPSLASILSSN